MSLNNKLPNTWAVALNVALSSLYMSHAVSEDSAILMTDVLEKYDAIMEWVEKGYVGQVIDEDERVSFYLSEKWNMKVLEMARLLSK